MIPATIEVHLQQHHGGYKHRAHVEAVTAQDLAAAEHVSGGRVAKPVIVHLDGKLAIAVVSAAHRLNVGALEEATGASAELAAEADFTERFLPCEPGAEPPLGIFGLPIFVDEMLTHEKTLVMPGGTHQDAIELETHEWLRCEAAQPVANLGVPIH
jgi:Ala-tRNA(Pro) deacylase